MSAIESVIKWSKSLPSWQADVVRRLLTKNEFSKQDEDDIFLMIKDEFQLEKNINAVKPKFPDLKEISGSSGSDDPEIKLKQMKCLKGINAIPDGSEINFSETGMSIIYGDNAAGKSGYARVLKKACKARDVSEQILSNVFKEYENEPAKALFKISTNAKPEKDIIWQDNQEESNELSSISVFDSKCVRVIIDNKNKAHYLPYGTHVFKELADIIQTLYKRIDDEKPIPQKPVIEELERDTKAGIFFESLSESTKKDEIIDNCKLTDEEQSKIGKLAKEILNAESNDPLKQANKLERYNEKLRSLSKHILGIRGAITREKIFEINELLKTQIAAENAVKEASKLSLANEPLKGAGTNSWQILYRAAKEFSFKHAYPKKDFPFLEEKSRCVLCMQELSNDAKDRFKRFKKFMEDKTQEELEEVKTKLNKILEPLNNIQFYKKELNEERLQDFDEFKEDLKDKIIDYLVHLEQRMKEMKDSFAKNTPFKFVSVSESPKRDIYDTYKTITDKIKKLKDSAKPEVISNLKKEKKELDSKKLLSTQHTNLRKYIEDLKRLKKYEDCLATLNTRKITTDGKKIISKTLSPQLKSALEDELKSSGGVSIPIFFKISGEYGTTEHQLQLNGKLLTKKFSLSQILSEGEQKVIAISGFLAELNTSIVKNPIVLDDPVCSLDHKYRYAIAKRLTKESLKRQVVIFTHDLSFLVMIYENLEKFGAKCITQSVECIGKKPGICTGEPPWYALNVSKRMGVLKNEFQKIKTIYLTVDSKEYENIVRPFYGKLRETWEKLVEELLLNGVIYRFGRDIQTQRVKLLTDITEQDFKKIDDNMKKCSRFMQGHDEAPDLNEPLPDPTDISNDLDNLDKYRIELSNTRKRSPRRG